MAERGWSDVAQAYAKTFAPLCDELADAVVVAAGVAGLPSRESVLDIGSGTGLLSARLTRWGASVVACEPDADLAALTTENAPTARLARAALPDLPFPDAAFRAVVANFVVNHVPDPRAAVRELARVTAPGSRVVITIWPSGQNAQSRLWAAVIEQAGAEVPASTVLPAELDFPRTTDGLAGLLTGAGLRQVRSELIRFTHRTRRDAFWEGAAAGVGGIGRTVTCQPEAVRRRMKAAYDRLLPDFMELSGEQVILHSEAILAVGCAVGCAVGRSA